ncbi:MAG: hypothetical protein U0790_05275 [Isosphaeraceae bacterium]
MVGALMLLLISAVSSRPAWAGCSRLAHPRQGSEASGAFWRLNGLLTGETLALVGGDPVHAMPTQPSPRRPAPCTGPSCSGQSPLPVSTGTSVVTPIEPWGLLTLTQQVPGPPCRHRREGSSLSFSSPMTSSIFHPPRPSLRTWASPAL